MIRDLSSFTAIVVDDEPAARAHTAFLLRQARVGRVLQAPGAAECLEIFQTLDDPPDWAFLDVQMPGMDGLALADALRAWQLSVSGSTRPPAVVYVTGFDDYAIQAFEHAAVDYLLKPVERERLATTLDRLVDAMGHPASMSPASLPMPALQILPVRLDYSTRLIPIDEIAAAAARDKRVEIITRDAVYPTYYTLTELDQRLPPERFVRVHDGWIVNLAEIVEIHNLGAQSYQLSLRHGGHMIPVSRRRLPILRERLGF